ncbi:glycosyltransferase family 1 protein [Phycicoccus sp. HDW14]|uniref:glycosyltransferase n=1 Tax=Phycicoccus sp. HDW14 TaxID=2714941 RepID=UPI0014086F65|nr:glycosyltransferase [Phycicoccus sp. HDW14]QIM21557.1 glycosyltransferase family 1 protein [Phycicoccus sp. HDW14]
MTAARPLEVLAVVGAMNRGGIETWLMNVVRALPPEEVRLSFLVHGDGPSDYDDEIHALGHRVLVCPLGRDVVGYARRLAGILRAEGPFDAVHSFTSTFSAVPLAVARARGVPVRIAHSQTDRRAVVAASGLPRRLYSRAATAAILRTMTTGLACTTEAAAFLFGPGAASDPRVRIVPNGIDLAPFAHAAPSLRAELGIAPDRLVVGHVGRFVAVKNQRFLVDVARRWRDADDDVTLVLVGDGPDREAVARAVRDAGLEERVHLVGLRTDVPGVLADLDVLVLPSLWEGAPITLVEAQASGVPAVVSHAVTGATDAVPGLVTRTPDGADADEWARTVLAVAAAPRPSREEAQATMAGTPWSLEHVVPLLRDAWSADRRGSGRG